MTDLSNNSKAAVAPLVPLTDAVRDWESSAKVPVPVDFGARAGCWIADGMFKLIFAVSVGVLTQAAAYAIGVAQAPVTLVASVAGYVGYELTEVIGTRSPGKWLLGLKIVGLDGRAAFWQERLVRYVVKNQSTFLVPAMVLFGKRVPGALWVGLGSYATFVVGSFIAASPAGQALHDLIPRTTVVDVVHRRVKKSNPSAGRGFAVLVGPAGRNDA